MTTPSATPSRPTWARSSGASQRGQQRAAVAVGHAILVIADHRLTAGTVYQDLGAQYCDERAQQEVGCRLVRRLAALGDTVALEPVAA